MAAWQHRQHHFIYNQEGGWMFLWCLKIPSSLPSLSTFTVSATFSHGKLFVNIWAMKKPAAVSIVFPLRQIVLRSNKTQLKVPARSVILDNPYPHNAGIAFNVRHQHQIPNCSKIIGSLLLGQRRNGLFCHQNQPGFCLWKCRCLGVVSLI